MTGEAAWMDLVADTAPEDLEGGADGRIGTPAFHLAEDRVRRLDIALTNLHLGDQPKPDSFADPARPAASAEEAPADPDLAMPPAVPPEAPVDPVAELAPAVPLILSEPEAGAATPPDVGRLRLPVEDGPAGSIEQGPAPSAPPAGPSSRPGPDDTPPDAARGPRPDQLLDARSSDDADESPVDPPDPNDAPTDAMLLEGSVDEAMDGGEAVGRVAVADPDHHESFIFALVDDGSGRFAIDGQGRITVVPGARFDTEAEPTVTLSVEVTDSAGHTILRTFTLPVADVDEFDVTTPVDTNTAADGIAENAGAGASTGITVASSDADAGTNAVAYTISDNRFAISAAGVVTVAPGAAFDAETSPTVTFTVTATSADGSTAQQSFTLPVADMDEFDVTTPVDTNTAADGIAENAGAGASTGITVASTDADASTNAVAYTISDNRFLVSAGGVVTVAPGAAFDAETSPTVTFTVTATSADGSTAQQSFTIPVADMDEFDVTTPVDTNTAADGIAENAGAGASTGITVASSDADAGTNAVTYAISDNRFQVSADGVVTVAPGAIFDRESEAAITLTVTATSADGSSSSQTFVLPVADVAEGILLTAGNDVFTDGGVAELSVDGLGGNDSLVGTGSADRLIGNDGNDTLVGGAGADTLQGGAGHDLLSYAAGTTGITVNLATALAGGGDAEGDVISGFEDLLGSQAGDRLAGGAGANAVDGGGGDDTITPTAGGDTLAGGAGRDLLDLSGETWNLTIDLSVTTQATGSTAGTVTLSGFENVTGGIRDDSLRGDGDANRLDGGGGNDTLVGQGGADTLIGGEGTDLVTYSDATGVTVNLATGLGSGGEAEGDVLSGIERVSGGAGADVLVGNAVDNFLEGGAGADTIDGGEGDDGILGGTGADSLQGGAGTDVLSYAIDAAGVTVNLVTGIGSGGDAEGDVFAGFENVVAGLGNDSIIGDDGANFIFASLGNDVVDAGGGDDIVLGAAGADTLIGGTGIDTLSYQYDYGNMTINLATNAASGGAAQGDVISGFENVVGSYSYDRLTGNSGANVIYGQSGNDTVVATAGGDTLAGGADVDTLDMSGATGGVTLDLSLSTAQSTGLDFGLITISGFEHVTGGAGADLLTGNASPNSISGGNGNDTIVGSAGADTLAGGTGTDTLSYAPSLAAVSVNLATNAVSGGDAAGDVISTFENVVGSGGNDTLTGSTGANSIVGGAGNDLIQGGAGNDTILGSAGADTLDGGSNTDMLSYSTSTGGVSVDLGTNAVSGGDAAGDVVSNFENVTGGSGNDTLIGSGGANAILGGAGNDFVVGGTGADTLDGGAGIDTLSYETSTTGVAVVLLYGLANGGDATGDVISNFENVIGSSGNDFITGSSAANVIDAGAGNDMIEGMSGADTIDGGAGVDTLNFAMSFTGVTVSLATGLGSANEAEGDVVSNIENVFGGAGNDALTGDDNANSIDGSNGNDTIVGGAGDDTLRGGLGFNTVDGGAGSDTFLVAVTENDQISGGAGGGWTDVISLQGFSGQPEQSGWTLVLDSGFTVASHGANELLLDPDAAGHIVFNDGTDVAFQGIEKITW